jgi:hypothetical protein
MNFMPKLASAALIAALPGTARAAEPSPRSSALLPAPEASEWEFLGALYAPLMGLEGDIGVGPITTAVDLSFGDILEELDGGLTAGFEARRDRWSITGDFIWLKLSASANPAANSYLRFRQEEILASVALGYELCGTERTTLDLLAGAALTSLDVDLELNTPALPVTTRTASGSQEWIDPFVGMRVRHRLSDRWGVFARAEYGGFGVSSEEYWQVLAGISYRTTECTSIALAYRIMAVDYHQAAFDYDTEMSGPNLGLVFQF